MKSEADFKKVIKASVRRQKGCAISLAAPMMVGLPDLFVAMPNYAPVLLEAKWLGEVKNKFNRKMNFTELQIKYIKDCNLVTSETALGIVGFKQEKTIKCVLLSYGCLHFYQITHMCLEDCPNVSYDNIDKQFDMQKLYSQSKIPRLNRMVSTIPHNSNGKCVCDDCLGVVQIGSSLDQPLAKFVGAPITASRGRKRIMDAP
jgi:hypothetical protein